MREALFGGGHDVSLDIDSLSVSWKSHGEQFDRPLAAFSSGEQTFAFTRARLAQLEANSGNIPNRIIAIDEFGAYLDIQRFSALVRYLHERRERVPTDQVLVILPWGTTAPADVSSRAVARRQRDLARRGYFAEALDA